MCNVFEGKASSKRSSIRHNWPYFVFGVDRKSTSGRDLHRQPVSYVSSLPGLTSVAVLSYNPKQFKLQLWSDFRMTRSIIQSWIRANYFSQKSCKKTNLAEPITIWNSFDLGFVTISVKGLLAFVTDEHILGVSFLFTHRTSKILRRLVPIDTLVQVNYM